MDTEQSRGGASGNRRSPVLRINQLERERVQLAGAVISGVVSGLESMSAALHNAQAGLSQFAAAFSEGAGEAGWEWGPDAFHSGPEDEGNDQNE